MKRCSTCTQPISENSEFFIMCLCGEYYCKNCADVLTKEELEDIEKNYPKHKVTQMNT